MKSKLSLFLVFAVCAFMIGISGCKEHDTTAGDIGRGIDKKVGNAGQKINATVDKAGVKIENAGQNIQDSVRTGN